MNIQLIKENKTILPLQELKRDDSPEQTISGHDSSSRSDPIHDRPLFFGYGLVHDLVRHRHFPPVICSHINHDDHDVQPPSTE